MTGRELKNEIHRIEERHISSDESSSQGEKYKESFDVSWSSEHFFKEYNFDESVGIEILNYETEELRRKLYNKEIVVVYYVTGSEIVEIKLNKNNSTIDVFLTLFRQTGCPPYKENIIKTQAHIFD